MSNMEELERVETSIKRDPALRAFLEQITTAARSGQAGPARTRLDVGPSELWLLGVAALWRLVNLGVDHLRSLSEAAAVEKQVRIIEELGEQSDRFQHAAPIVETLFKEIRARRHDDSLLESLKKLEASTGEDGTTD